MIYNSSLTLTYSKYWFILTIRLSRAMLIFFLESRQHIFPSVTTRPCKSEGLKSESYSHRVSACLEIKLLIFSNVYRIKASDGAFQRLMLGSFSFIYVYFTLERIELLWFVFRSIDLFSVRFGANEILRSACERVKACVFW